MLAHLGGQVFLREDLTRCSFDVRQASQGALTSGLDHISGDLFHDPNEYDASMVECHSPQAASGPRHVPAHARCHPMIGLDQPGTSRIGFTRPRARAKRGSFDALSPRNDSLETRPSTRSHQACCAFWPARRARWLLFRRTRCPLQTKVRLGAKLVRRWSA